MWRSRNRMAGRQQVTGTIRAERSNAVFGQTSSASTRSRNGAMTGVHRLARNHPDASGSTSSRWSRTSLPAARRAVSRGWRRGGISATIWFQNTCNPAGTAWLNGPACTGNNASGTWRKGIEENRITVGVDSRYRLGGFSLDPTVMYQFGNRSLIAPSDGALPIQFSDPVNGAGVVPGKKYTSQLAAWFADIRAGYQLGPAASRSDGDVHHG